MYLMELLAGLIWLVVLVGLVLLALKRMRH